MNTSELVEIPLGDLRFDFRTRLSVARVDDVAVAVWLFSCMLFGCSVALVFGSCEGAYLRSCHKTSSTGTASVAPRVPLIDVEHDWQFHGDGYIG